MNTYAPYIFGIGWSLAFLIGWRFGVTRERARLKPLISWHTGFKELMYGESSRELATAKEKTCGHQQKD